MAITKGGLGPGFGTPPPPKVTHPCSAAVTRRSLDNPKSRDRRGAARIPYFSPGSQDAHKPAAICLSEMNSIVNPYSLLLYIVQGTSGPLSIREISDPVITPFFTIGYNHTTEPVPAAPLVNKAAQPRKPGRPHACNAVRSTSDIHRCEPRLANSSCSDTNLWSL